MNRENLKEGLEMILGDSCPADPILEVFYKLDDEGIAPYGIASSLVLACCSLMNDEDKENHDKLMDFMIDVAKSAKSNFGN